MHSCGCLITLVKYESRKQLVCTDCCIFLSFGFHGSLGRFEAWIFFSEQSRAFVDDETSGDHLLSHARTARQIHVGVDGLRPSNGKRRRLPRSP
ncbi:hypothetical protein BRADI_3g38030v3 [Brachypodium distachyon]|uniref:Uncharacterized protein n=1 Tax=Brachypodium distachyon TaxID=15368 RepID=A0A2K2D1W3_BRADI|nr:hypothetical protein BRADI_3g38030v3 [Brachypodium distachyon]